MKEEPQVDFHEQFGTDLISLRLISAKLIEARMLAGDLQWTLLAKLSKATIHPPTPGGAFGNFQGAS